MIEINKTEVFGLESAIRGMRNPMNSWDKSDSGIGCKDENCLCKDCDCQRYPGDCAGEYIIGQNDLKLMKSLSKAGSDHGKFLRMINVTCDINAPLYWWKEFDTYKVGTVANSCSTMHKIHTKEFTFDDFSCEHLTSYTSQDGLYFFSWEDAFENTIHDLNFAREIYLETKDKKYWWQMIQMLPSSYNQKRTVQLNYQVLKNMYNARKSHKLDEWKSLCAWCETLPHFKEICLGGDQDE